MISLNGLEKRNKQKKVYSFCCEWAYVILKSLQKHKYKFKTYLGSASEEQTLCLLQGEPKYQQVKNVCPTSAHPVL